MLVRSERLNEARALLRGLAVPAPKQPRSPEHPVHTRRAHRNYVRIHHHVRQTSITLVLVLLEIGNDCGPLPVFKPEVTGNPGVVFVDHAVSLPPLVELTPADTDPPQKTNRRKTSPVRPVANVIHNIIAPVRFHP